MADPSRMILVTYGLAALSALALVASTTLAVLAWWRRSYWWSTANALLALAQITLLIWNWQIINKWERVRELQRALRRQAALIGQHQDERIGQPPVHGVEPIELD